MARDSFILYNGFWKPIERMSNDQLGRLFRALFLYQIEGAEDVDGDIAMAFGFFKNRLDIDSAKYERVCKARQQAGAIGGRRRQANQANATNCYQMEANQADNVNEDVNENYNGVVDVVVNNNGAHTRVEDTNTNSTTTNSNLYLDYLRVIFFRNIPNAEQEARRFVGYYDSIDWTLQGGDRLDGNERLARAELWTPEQKGARFPRAFLDAWWKVYKRLPDHLRKGALRDCTRIATRDKALAIYCDSALAEWLTQTEEGLRTGRDAFATMIANGTKVTIYKN